MIPKSFSATALNTAEGCLARYKAEHIDRADAISNTAALLGSSVHGALEMYVKNVILEGNRDNENLNFLLDLYKMSYMTTFETGDISTDEYKEGAQMLKEWFERTTWDGVDVLSVEVKENFPVPTPIGEIPFNYIWDRHDQIGEATYRVVDYKTNRWGLRPEDLKRKIQARAYGLACQIKHPDAQRVWVEFDMLRHGGPVGVVFTKEDNAATWRFFKEAAKRIVNTPDDEVPETLNAECNFCVRKFSCEAIRKNIAAGGIFAGGTAKDLVDTRAQLEFQKKALDNAIKEIDEIILTEARQSEVFEFESDTHKLRISASSRRTVDADRVSLVIGPKLFDKYGGKSFTIASVDKLLKSDELDEMQKRDLRGLIYQRPGQESVKAEAKFIV